VGEVADRGPRDADLDRPLARGGEAGTDPEQRRLPGAVRAGDDGEPAARDVEVDPAEHPLVAEALAELSRPNHPGLV
jgi:hypothetical protein